jgi:hypothetical protein
LWASKGAGKELDRISKIIMQITNNVDTDNARSRHYIGLTNSPFIIIRGIPGLGLLARFVI